MKKRFLLVVVLMAALVGGATAQILPGGKSAAKKANLEDRVPVDKKVKIGHLDNGFTYYLRVNKKPENRIQFRLVTNAGSILENEKQLGLAHFCEHMAFNGTEYYPHNSMISELQKNGVTFGSHVNAYTSFDETVYFINMPNSPEMVEMGIEILDGWAGKLLFDQKEIEAERGVIHEEWRGTLGAGDRMRKKIWPIMLKGSRYAERIPIGTEEVIMNFKRNEIVDFYHDWYRPDLQAIIIVGDFNLADMEAKVKEYFGKYKKVENAKERVYYDVPGNKEPLVAIATDKEATSTSLSLMWKHAKAPQGTVGQYRESLVRQLINSMINARFAELSEKSTAPMLYAAGGYGGFIGRSCDAFSLNAYPKDNRIEEATRLLLTEMKRIDQHGFLSAELERQKEEMLDGFRKSAAEVNKTQSQSFADEYTRNYLEGEVIPGIRQEYAYAQQFLPEITVDECNKVVADWITDENLIIYLTAPEKADLRIPTEKEMLRIFDETKNIKTEAWVDNFVESPLYSKEVAAVTPKVTKTDNRLGYTEYTVPNGIRFVVKKTDYKADEIRMRSYAMGGTSLYSDEESFAAGLAASFVDDAGIGEFSATQLSKKLKGRTVGISPSISGRTQGFSGSCSPKDLETMLQLLNLYYEAPRKDQESFDRNIQALKTQLPLLEQNPQVAMLKAFYKAAYPNYNRMHQFPTMEEVDALSYDRIFEIFKERFEDASNQTFFFVGNVSDDDIKMIAKYLNNLPCNGMQKMEKAIRRDPNLAPGISRGLARKGTERMSLVLMVSQAEGFEPTFKNRVIVDALGECVQISTTEIIREKMGDAYSPMGGVDYSLEPEGSVSYQFFIQCDPDKTDKVEAAALDVLKMYIKKGPSKEVLAKAKEQMIKNRETSAQENGFWMNQLYSTYYYGEDRDEWVNRYADLVNSITEKDVQEVAKQFLYLKHYAVGVLKPENAK